MTNGNGGHDVLFEMGGRIGHAPAEARWAKPATLARKRDDFGVAAGAADQVQAALFQDPAAQIVLELSNHELRQATGFFGALAERGKVAVYRLMKRRLLGQATAITVRSLGGVRTEMSSVRDALRDTRRGVCRVAHGGRRTRTACRRSR